MPDLSLSLGCVTLGKSHASLGLFSHLYNEHHPTRSEEGYLQVNWVRIFPGTQYILYGLVVTICLIIIIFLLSLKMNILKF